MAILKNIISILVVICTLRVCSAQIYVDGKCRNNTLFPMRPFNASRYLGLWYETQRYEATFQENGECVTAYYDSIIGEDALNVTNSMRNASGFIHTRNAFATQNEPYTGAFTVLFNVSLPEGSPEAIPSDYIVILTDYNRFAIVWNCREAKNSTVTQPLSVEYLWVLSRTPQMTSLSQTVIDLFIDLFFDKSLIRNTVQTTNVCGSANGLIAGLFLVFFTSILNLLK